MLNCNFRCMRNLFGNFFCFFVNYENREHNNSPCYIRFRLSDITYEINLPQFSGCCNSLLKGRLIFFIGIIAMLIFGNKSLAIRPVQIEGRVGSRVRL